MKLKVNNQPPYDPFQCFVRENHVAIEHTHEGDLSGLVFAAKDVFDVKGSTYSNGHPTWLATHPVATENSIAIDVLLNHGADLVGKTICDELCYSISGENWHYGSPIHPLDPMRYAGGSSSGSAVAVSGGLADFSIGSDCLGSVRVPASYNGLYGMRPSYQRVDNTGEAPYCKSMDILGCMAKEPDIFKRVIRVLLKEDKRTFHLEKLVTMSDLFKGIEKISLDDADWVDTFRIVQGYEVWQSYGDWIAEYNPHINPGPKERLEWASQITAEAYQQALLRKEEILIEIQALLSDDTILVIPTASSPAIHRMEDTQRINQIRSESSKLLCISPLSNTPQVTLPFHTVDGLPFGISFIGPVGSDNQLIEKALELKNTIARSLQ